MYLTKNIVNPMTKMHKATIKASIRISSITVDAQSLNRKVVVASDNQHILSSSN
jgi:hypothetical protein